jgi:hypothetical protein
MQQRLRRSVTAPDQASGFGDRQPVEDDEHKNCTLGGRERAERFVQRGSLVETRTPGVAVVHADLANLELHPPALLAFEASEVVG